MLRSTAVAFLLISGVVHSAAAATPMVYDTTPSPAGNAHFVASSEKTLSEADLTATPRTMLATGDHTVTVTVSKPSVGTPAVDVRFTTDGSPTTTAAWLPMTAGSPGSTLPYQRVLSPVALGTSSPAERTVRLAFRITNGDYGLLDDNGGVDYRYIADSRAPTQGALTINGNPTFTGQGSTPATFLVPVSDVSAITTATLLLVGPTTSSHPMSIANGTATKAFPSGLGLPDGDYSARTTFADEHGLSRTTDAGIVVHLAAPPPPPPPPPPLPPPPPGPPELSNARFNGRPAASLGSATPFTATVDVGGQEVIATVRLRLLSPGGVALQAELAPGSGATFTLSKPDGLQLPDGTYDAVFIATSQTNRTGSLFLPGAVTLDSQPPNFLGLTLNGDATIQVNATSPVAIRLVADGTPASAAIDFLNDASTSVRHVDLARAGDGSFQATVPGMNLADGSYRARVTLTDSNGNQQATTLGQAPLVIDSTPPSLSVKSLVFPDGQTAAKQGDVLVLVVRAQDSGTVTSVAMQTPTGPRQLTKAGQGLYQVEVTAGPGNGARQIVITAQDTAGQAASLPVTYTLDNTPPRILSTSSRYPSDMPSAAFGETVRLQALVADEGSRVERAYFETALLNEDTPLVLALAKPATNLYQADVFVTTRPGTYSIPVTLFDAAGNEGRAAIPVDVRPEGPAIGMVLVDGAPTFAAREPAPFTLDAFALAAHSMTYEILGPSDTAAQGTLRKDGHQFHADVTARLDVGSYHLRLIARDSDGRNATWISPDPVIFVDPDAPKITALYADVGGTHGNSTSGSFGDAVHLRLVATDASPLHADAFVLTPRGARISLNVSQVVDGEWRATASFLETGTFTVTASLTDLAGNAATQTTQFRLIPKSATMPGSVENLRRTSPGSSPFAVIRWDAPAGTIAGYEATLDDLPSGIVNSFQESWVAPRALAQGPHSLRVAVLNQDGNWGPAATLSFRIGNGLLNDTIALEDSSSIPILAAVKLPSAIKEAPSLVWAIRGRSDAVATVKCVEIDWKTGHSGYAILDACIPGTGTDLLKTLDFEEGDVITIQGRLILKDGTAGEWVGFGTTRVDRTPPKIQPPVLVDGASTAPGATPLVDVAIMDASVTEARLEVYRDGQLVQTIGLEVVDGPARATLAALEPGAYSLRVVAIDAAGNSAAQAGPTFVARSAAAPSSATEPDDSWQAWLKVGAVVVVLGAIAAAWFLRRRKRTAASMPPLMVHLDGVPTLLPPPRGPMHEASGDAPAQRI